MNIKEYFDDLQNRKKLYWRVPLYIVAVLCIWWSIDNISLAVWWVSHQDEVGEATYENEVQKAGTLPAGSIFTDDVDGTIFTYKFNPDGTFTETIRASMGTLRGEGTYTISGNEVILYGVNPIGGSTTMRIDRYKIQQR